MIHLMDLSIDRNRLCGRLRPAHYGSRFCNVRRQGTRDPKVESLGYFQSSADGDGALDSWIV
jgi:hypothetical protein